MTARPRRRAAALRYDPQQDDAPRVVARGEGHVADRIIEIARQEGIPIHENAAVVDVLSRLDLDREIPPELYRVVAEIIAFVFRVQAAADPDHGGARGAARDGAPAARRR
jgi:flagellar biosynthesis protein